MRAEGPLLVPACHSALAQQKYRSVLVNVDFDDGWKHTTSELGAVIEGLTGGSSKWSLVGGDGDEHEFQDGKVRRRDT